MDQNLMKKLEGNVAWMERTMLSVSEAREIVNAIKSRPDQKRIEELEARVAELEEDLAEAWRMAVPL